MLKEQIEAAFFNFNKTSGKASISLEEALDLFKLPRIIGEFEGKEVKANVGRYGPYIQFNKSFVSIPKDEDLMTIELDRSIELILQKRDEDKNKLIRTYNEREDVQVLNGRYGAYIKIGKSNYKIPKGREAADLSLEDCLEIAESQKTSKSKKRKS